MSGANHYFSNGPVFDFLNHASVLPHPSDLFQRINKLDLKCPPSTKIYLKQMITPNYETLLLFLVNQNIVFLL